MDGWSKYELASSVNLTYPVGTEFALVDRGSTVQAWINTGSGFTQRLVASDSTYSGGSATIQAKGGVSRSTNFRFGNL